ncbi:MAG: carbonic anhydrase [Deltaproteobacteria bacterium]|nr:carbonic anhydrase [Deltaproteobacteria bacterium]
MKMTDRKKGLGLFVGLAMCLTGVMVWASSAGPGISPDEALARLKQGNDRYVSGKAEHPRADKQRREETATKGQHPIAAVIGCSDSRGPVEIIFDQGIGDVFVIRVAGNVANADEVGSAEYAVEHLGAPVIVVLGHTSCGAVTAVAKGAHLGGSLPPLVKNINTAVAKVKKADPKLADQALVDAAIKANVWQSIEDLFKTSPDIRKFAKEGKIKLVGAMYHLDSGQVDWMGQHPDQAKFLGAAAQAAPAKKTD